MKSSASRNDRGMIGDQKGVGVNEDSSGQSVAVIGGGPAGCAAAHRLSSAGLRVYLYERAPHLGGRTWTYRQDGHYLDTGAGFITNFYPRLWALADELGIKGKIKELERVTGLFSEGQLARLNVGSTVSFLRFPHIGLWDKIRMASWTGKLTVQRRRYELTNLAKLAPLDTRSIAQLADEELSPAIYHHLIRPGIEPFWYFSCEDVSAAMAESLTAHAAGARFYYVDGGIDQICQALASQATVTLSSDIQRVERVADGFTVSGVSGDRPLSREVDHVVVATTANAAHSMTTSLSSQWVPATVRDFLRQQRYAANIHVSFKISRLEVDPKLNSIFPSGEGKHPLAALSFHRAKQGNNRDTDAELISVYLSDLESRRVMAWTDEEIAERAWCLAREVYPRLPKSRAVYHLHRRREAIPVHAVGRYKAALAVQEAQATTLAGVYFCGDYLSTATIDGAIETGLRAAEMVLATGD